jgi:hypothetical protein
MKPKRCDHKEKDGEYLYDVEDDRCDTDRGTMGSVGYFCQLCGADITDLIMREERDEEDAEYE